MRVGKTIAGEVFVNVRTVRIAIPSTPSKLSDRLAFLVLCGRWETYPREFAKCRRCRKAKYCGKECQSTAWSEGHRFWCSAKEGDEEAAEPADQQAGTMHPEVVVADEAHEIPPPGMTMTAGGTRAERTSSRT